MILSDIKYGTQWVRNGSAKVSLMKLTEKIIAGLDCEAGQKDRLVFDDTIRGLGLRISHAGAKSFLVQYLNASGTKRRLPIGAWGAITLEQARQAAQSILGQVANGRDPYSERNTAKENAQREADGDKLTLSALLLDWQSIGLASRRENYRREAVRAVSFAFNPFLKRRADALRRADVVGVLDALVKAGKGPTANRTTAYGRACYSWAVKRGLQCIQVEIRYAEIQALIRRGLLVPSEASSVTAIRSALYKHLDRTLA